MTFPEQGNRLADVATQRPARKASLRRDRTRPCGLGAENACQRSPPCWPLSERTRRPSLCGCEIKSRLSQGPRAQQQIPRAKTMTSASSRASAVTAARALGRLGGDADEQTRREAFLAPSTLLSTISAGYRLGCFLFLFTPQWERKAIIPKIFRRRMSTSNESQSEILVAIKYRI